MPGGASEQSKIARGFHTALHGQFDRFQLLPENKELSAGSIPKSAVGSRRSQRLGVHLRSQSARAAITPRVRWVEYLGTIASHIQYRWETEQQPPNDTGQRQTAPRPDLSGFFGWPYGSAQTQPEGNGISIIQSTRT